MGVIEGSIPRGAGVERGPGTVWYVDTVNGSNSYSGDSWQQAKLTMAATLALVGSGDTIFFVGRVKEQVTTPVNVFDVSIVGMAQRPRHADASPAGGNQSAQWQAPDSPTATTPLIKVLQQGWHFENMLMDAPSDAACVQLFRNGGAGDLERDASHASFKGIRFVGGDTGIEDSGGVGHVLVDDCEFHDLTNGIKSVTGAGIGQPLLRSTIRNCRFRSNTNHVVSASQEAHIIDNVFGSFTTVGINLAGGVGKNVVCRNALSGTYSSVGGYTVAAADDEWGGNYNSLTGGVTAADPG